MIYTFSAFILALLLVVIQDFKSRSYYTIILPALFVLSYIINVIYFKGAITVNDIVFNTAYSLLTFLVLQFYYTFKKNKKELIFKKAFALGDALFILFLATMLPFKSFILFLIASSILGIVYYLLSSNAEKNRGIPFAGIMALLFIPVLIFRYSFWI